MLFILFVGALVTIAANQNVHAEHGERYNEFERDESKFR